MVEQVTDLAEFNRKALGLPSGWLPKTVIARAYLVQVLRNDRGAYNIAGCDVPAGLAMGQIVQVKHVANKGQELASPFNKVGTWATLVLAENAETGMKDWWAVAPIKISWRYN